MADGKAHIEFLIEIIRYSQKYIFLVFCICICS